MTKKRLTKKSPCEDWLQFKREEWEAPEGGLVEPPIHVVLQMVQQELCGGYGASAVAVLVGGNDLRISFQEHSTAAAQKVFDRAAAFWSAVADGIEPAPDFSRDGEILKRLFAKPDPRLALADDQIEPAMDAAAAYVAARNDEGTAGKAKETAAAHLMHLMRETEEAALPDGSRITWRADKRGRRTLRVTAPKEAVPMALAAE